MSLQTALGPVCNISATVVLSWGRSNRDIAEKPGISRQAVENLVNNLNHKLAIAGEPKDPGRQVLLVLSMQGISHPA